jgi:hypothetical protein
MVKKKLLVIADKNAAVKSFSRHVLIARQFLKANCWDVQPLCIYWRMLIVVAESVGSPRDWE